LLKQDWKVQFKSQVEKHLSVLGKSPKSKEDVIETVFDNYYCKMEDINIDVFIKDLKPENQRARAILDMALYLWEYEGRFSFCINMLCFLLISNGHDLYHDYKKRYVKSFEDVESISIARKCQFLTHHGFEIFNEKKNKVLEKFRQLRNDVAHYNLIIRGDEGKIKVYNYETKNWEQVPLILFHGDLMEFSSDMLMILIECMH
jgi:hypothetical protein